jgi:hypothetical protein
VNVSFGIRQKPPSIATPRFGCCFVEYERAMAEFYMGACFCGAVEVGATASRMQWAIVIAAPVVPGPAAFTPAFRRKRSIARSPSAHCAKLGLTRCGISQFIR